MKIKLWIENEGGHVRDLGTCICDSVNRALQMYEDDPQDGEWLMWDFVEGEKCLTA